jgi:hypothetical protein
VVQRYKKPFKLIRHFGAWRVAEQNLVMKRLVHRLDHTQRGSLTFLNKYVAVASSVCVGCRAASFKRRCDRPRRRTFYEEEGVEAMELTVDGKARPTTVVYARRRKSLLAFRSLHWVQMPPAPSIIRSAFTRASGRCPSPSGAQQNVGDAIVWLRPGRGLPLSRITDGAAMMVARLGAACQDVSG